MLILIVIYSLTKLKTCSTCSIKTKYISEKRLNCPWISQAVLNSVKFKNGLYKDYRMGAISEEYYKKY